MGDLQEGVREIYSNDHWHMLHYNPVKITKKTLMIGLRPVPLEEFNRSPEPLAAVDI